MGAGRCRGKRVLLRAVQGREGSQGLRVGLWRQLPCSHDNSWHGRPVGELWAEGERWAGCGVQARPGQLAQEAELAGWRSREQQQLRGEGGGGEGRADRGGGATGAGGAVGSNGAMGCSVEGAGGAEAHWLPVVGLESPEVLRSLPRIAVGVGGEEEAASVHVPSAAAITTGEGDEGWGNKPGRR